jgi:large subunit ribosomal protein L30
MKDRAMTNPGKTIKVTLVRSTAGRLASHRACVRGLGLRRIGHAVEVEDTPAVRGMIDRVEYLLKVEGA